jgi:hypothetical protein
VLEGSRQVQLGSRCHAKLVALQALLRDLFATLHLGNLILQETLYRGILVGITLRAYHPRQSGLHLFPV